MNTEKITILQNKIIQWNETQSELLNRYMSGEITKEEYKGRNESLNKDIDGFKSEINELTK